MPKKPLLALPVLGSLNQQSGPKQAEVWNDALMPKGSSLRGETPVRLSKRPLVIMAVVSIILIVGLMAQLFSLQIVNGSRYAGLAQGNRLREKINYAQRGRILDRNGIVLAENVPSFQVVITPFLLAADETARYQTYRDLAALLKIKVGFIKDKAEAKGIDFSQPILIKDAINYEDALRIDQKLPDLKGVSLDVVPVRKYKSDSGLAHILGYVSRANEQDLESNRSLFPTDFVGRDGIEAQYDKVIRGRNGLIQTEVDASGRPIRTLSELPAKSGTDITLTIDYKLQRTLAKAIAEQMKRAKVDKGSGVAMDPETGEILASVSLPSYDNNLFNQGIAAKDYQRLLADKRQPLYNNVVAGGFPSGSIIKPLHLAAALEEGVVSESTVIVDTGKLVIPSQYDPSVTYTFLGWRPGGLGPMNARRAIAMSSNIYFFTTGGGYRSFKGLGVDKLTDWYREFGLGETTGIDLPGETNGRVPTPEWKRQALGEDWFVGDTYNVSIGQGYLLVSPLQMVRAISSIGNGGKLLTPHLLKDGRKPVVVKQNFVSSKNLNIIQDGMEQVIGGTTNPATFAKVPVKVAAKSGTAETDPLTKRKPHAWYTAYAPASQPKLAMVVLLEEGEGGSQYAAPAIAKAMEYYFKN